jgi:polysaccharide chain length determinant protein (PEP-CTERM system associated)
MESRANDSTVQDTPGDLSETIVRFVGAIIRHRWWVLVTASTIIIATAVVLTLLPNRYTSQATIIVVQQSVPERYVVPTATTDLNRVLEAMMQEVLSRPQLLALIDEFGLYRKERQHLAPELMLSRMRDDIDVKPLEPLSGSSDRKDLNAFKISFTASTPLIAQEVTSRLTSLFIQTNLNSRARQATNTTSFLHEQLEAAKAKLTDSEQKLKDFKMQYLGSLPEQQQGNLAILASIQSQLQNTEDGLDRARQQKVYLQSMMDGYRRLASQAASTASAIGVSQSNGVIQAASPLDAARLNLARLQAKEAELRTTYGAQYPEVLEVQRQIAVAEAAFSSLKSAKPTVGGSGAEGETAAAKTLPVNGTAPVPSEDNASIAQIESQLEANRLEIANLSKDEAQSKAKSATYQDRLNLTPVREQQLAGLMRDDELLKKEYSDLLSKELESQLATNLEEQQGGQQFRLIDPPALPTVPSSPKRSKIALGGAAGGIVLGLALAFLVDLKDHSFHREKDLMRQLRFPIIVSVPLVLTAKERRNRAWRKAFEWFGGAVVAMSVSAAGLYMYLHR